MTDPAPGQARLELALAPEDLARLIRVPGVRRRARPAPADTDWHDAPDGRLEAAGLILARRVDGWTLEHLHPAPALPWPPATPAPVLAAADDPAALGSDVPVAPVPVAAFRGRLRRLRFALPDVAPGAALEADAGADGRTHGPTPGGAAVKVDLLHGGLRGAGSARPACRVVLRGRSEAVARACAALAEAVPLGVPRASLAAEALAAARDSEPPPRRLGAPEVPADAALSDLVAHVLGHLTDVLLHWSRRAGTAQTPRTPEPVHQMRVALRRLRSAVSVFRGAAGGPALDRLKPGLRELMRRAGAARDWDVFLDGPGAELAALLPGDRRASTLLAAARRRREAAYAALRAELASPGFRDLALALAQTAALRPWEADAGPERGGRADAYAARVLDRRWKRTAARAENLAELPDEALHELRKDGKRLRYAAECFAPLFAGKRARRFFKRLAAVQEALGRLNDAAVAAELVAALGPAGRGFAGGIVVGLAAARAADARGEARRAWKRLRRAGPFWR